MPTKIPMEIINASVPWSDVPVRKVVGAREQLGRFLNAQQLEYLPCHIDLYADRGVQTDRIECLLDTASKFLVKEMAIREARIWRLLRSGLCGEDEIQDVFRLNSHRQKWALYYSAGGGLPAAPSDPRLSERGIVPCSTMRNHGVCWKRGPRALEVWLVTAPQPGQDWDMNSDIGHESAHAAFAPVPLFVQSASNSAATASLLDVDGSENLDPYQVARLLYFCSELAVVGIRGESRRNYTRLPIEDSEELSCFLRLCNELFPDAGFDRAQSTFKRVRGNFDLEQSDAVFDLTAPVLRILPRLNQIVDTPNPPPISALRKLELKTPTGAC